MSDIIYGSVLYILYGILFMSVMGGLVTCFFAQQVFEIVHLSQ